MAVRIIWYDEVLWGDANLVGRWAGRVSRTVTNQTRAHAPVNKRAVKNRGVPGQLKSSIRTRSQNRTGLRSREFSVAMIYYGAYVIRGTQGPIRPARGNWLKLPVGLPGPMGLAGVQFYRSVSGQSSNDFLGRAWDSASVRHPAIRGKLRYI